MNRKNPYRVDLSSHMAECDANYVRLMRLAPDLTERSHRRIGIALFEGTSVVTLSVVERCPYTTMVHVLQCFPQASLLPQPMITVRLYHDTQSAEVTEYQNARGFHAVYAYPNDSMRQPDEKVQVNRLLGELLAMCLQHGLSVEHQTALTPSG